MWSGTWMTRSGEAGGPLGGRLNQWYPVASSWLTQPVAIWALCAIAPCRPFPLLSNRT